VEGGGGVFTKGVFPGCTGPKQKKNQKKGKFFANFLWFIGVTGGGGGGF